MINDMIGYLLILFSYHISYLTSISTNFSNNSIDIFEDNRIIYENNKTIDIKFDNYFVENYVQTYRLPDGEVITKLKYSNFTAIETRFADLSLRQITDGTQLIQLWLSNEELLDCEFTTDTKSVRQLLKDFNKTEDKHIVAQNQTELSSDNTTLSSKWSYLSDYKQYRDRCHRLHKKLMKQINKKSKRSESKRWKRADLLVFPGTNWCGKGSNSMSFEDLGQHSFADRCCRDHDYCKYTIPPFSWKFHLFNYRFHYVSHCSCDERFRSCLKLANTGASNLVGKVFFNIVQTRCFLFKTEKVCTRRSWWGKCLNNRRKKRAFFRNGLKY